uniref:Ig-like domain-containing protein n=1 Tax=Cyprinodon variegatus TaxID=28743 RepID=A0A3Q2CX88_CYPVA
MVLISGKKSSTDIKMAENSPFRPLPSNNAKIKGASGLQNDEGETQGLSAPVFTRKLRKAAVGTGCDIRLRVSVSGNPKPLMTWYHNEKLIPPSEAQDSGGLWIRDCHTNNAGLYTCVASNELGEASCSAVLAVMDLDEGKHGVEEEPCQG